MPSSPTRSHWAPGRAATDDRRADGTSDPRRDAGADGAVPRLQGIGNPVGQTAYPAARVGVSVPAPAAHATGVLVTGGTGRQLPAGLTKEQAIAAARARGDNTFADLLSAMNVVPGRGGGCPAGRPRPRLG